MGGERGALHNQVVLVTGSAGLIGRSVSALLRAAGAIAIPFDLRSERPEDRGDILDAGALERAMQAATGVIHLAAVSRVIHGEQDPARCWAVNVEATGVLLDIALSSSRAPWVVYASSREVYGQQDVQPVPETAPLRPKNVYARSKMAAERRMEDARAAGLATAILRFSNVYGDVTDHPDRVVPAFARIAATGGRIRIDGADCTFDFTHIADVADGILRAVRMLCAGERDLPAIHFVTGIETSLGALAELAILLGGASVAAIEAPARSFDVHRFCGDPSNAAALLGWRATTLLNVGLARLVAAHRSAATTTQGPFAAAARE